MNMEGSQIQVYWTVRTMQICLAWIKTCGFNLLTRYVSFSPLPGILNHQIYHLPNYCTYMWISANPITDVPYCNKSSYTDQWRTCNISLLCIDRWNPRRIKYNSTISLNNRAWMTSKLRNAKVGSSDLRISRRSSKLEENPRDSPIRLKLIRGFSDFHELSYRIYRYRTCRL